MKTINGKVDNDVLAFIIRNYGEPIAALPAPYVKESLNGINPNATFFFYPGNVIRASFSIKQVYYLHKITKQWRPMTEVASHNGNRKIILNDKWTDIHPSYLKWLQWRTSQLGGQVLIPSPKDMWGATKQYINYLNLPDRMKVGLSTLTKYPDTGNPGSVTCDGDIENRAVATWVTCRGTPPDSTTGTSLDHGGTGFLEGEYGIAAAQFYLHRFVTNFDTSALTAGATISATSLFFTYQAASGSFPSAPSMSLVTNTIVSNTAYATSDFGKFNTTKQAPDLLWSTFSSSNLGNSFVLDSTGMSNVSLTGVTKFGWLCDLDISNTTPLANNFCEIYSADDATSARDENLVVTYTTGGAVASPVSTLLLMGVG